jgi:hypothetical protein
LPRAVHSNNSSRTCSSRHRQRLTRPARRQGSNSNLLLSRVLKRGYSPAFSSRGTLPRSRYRYCIPPSCGGTASRVCCGAASCVPVLRPAFSLSLLHPALVAGLRPAFLLLRPVLPLLRPAFLAGSAGLAGLGATALRALGIATASRALRGTAPRGVGGVSGVAGLAGLISQSSVLISYLSFR